MTETNSILTRFIEDIKQHQAVWGLQDESGEAWVVCDSSEYEDTDVMPLWSTEAQAKTHCSEEWANYAPIAITLTDLLEFWITDLHEDGVLIGTNWQADQDCLEMDPVILAKSLVNVEEA